MEIKHRENYNRVNPLTSACTRTAKPLRDLSAGDAERYA